MNKPCQTIQEAVNFWDYEPSDELLERQFVPAVSITYDESGEQTGARSEEGWDVYCKDEYVCRVFSKGEAQNLASEFKSNPGLSTVYLVSES